MKGHAHYLTSIAKESFHDYRKIWINITTYQLVARGIIFGLFALIKGWGIIWIFDHSNSLSPLSNYEVFGSIQLDRFLILTAIVISVLLITFFMEYAGLVYMMREYYMGQNVSTLSVMQKVGIRIPKFFKALSLKLVIHIGYLSTYFILALIAWTLLPISVFKWVLSVMTLVVIIIIWNTAIKLSFVNYRVYEPKATLFKAFDYNPPRKLLESQRVFSVARFLFFILSLFLWQGFLLLGFYILSFLTEFNVWLPAIVSGFMFMIFGIIAFSFTFIIVAYSVVFQSKLYFSHTHKLPKTTHVATSVEKFVWNKSKNYILVGLLVMFSVSAIDQSKSFYSGVLDLDRPFIIMAHRGGREGLDNSFEAIESSIKDGVQAIEIDVRVTYDGIPVVFHDETISDKSQIRRVPDLSYSEVVKIDLVPETAELESVVTLDELVRKFGQNVKFNVEVKTEGGISNSDLDSILSVLDWRLKYKPIVSSLDYSVSEYVSNVNPNIETGFIVTVDVGDISQYDVDWLIVNNVFYKTFRDRFVGADQMIILWSFSDNWDGFEAYSLGADGVIVDDSRLPQKLIVEFLSQPLYKQARAVFEWVWSNR